MNRFLIISLCAGLALSMIPAYGYGPAGHAMVGTIADEKLAGTPVGEKVTQMLDGLSLAQAAVIPDEIKSWDKHGPDDPRSFHRRGHPDLDRQLSDFWKANPPLRDAPEDRNEAQIPSHHWFHYTDVPVLDDEKYDSGAAGRSKWDIVHTMAYCIRVLRGEESDHNARAITKPVALILLTHYIGDIHQPLHVGAEYFDSKGQPVNPDKGVPAFPDEGGNSLFVIFQETVAPGKHTTLHGYWDNQAVRSAFGQIQKGMHAGEPDRADAEAEAIAKEIAHHLASQEPPNWKPAETSEIDEIGKKWADEILPIAQAAYDRLQFDGVAPKEEHGHTIAAGFVREKPMPDGISYEDWSGGIVAKELHQAGWRLADLLQKIL